jgi:hypothetical protein
MHSACNAKRMREMASRDLLSEPRRQNRMTQRKIEK